MKRIMLFWVMMFVSAITYAQTEYLMAGSATYTTCDGIFYDSGGADGNYPDDVVQVVTFCPDQDDAAIQVFFEEFDISGGDYLEIYDGDAITLTNLMATYPQDLPQAGGLPATHIASGGNATGCLTFRFVSNSTNNAAGWKAIVECQAPCQTIVASVLDAVPEINEDNIIKACIGQPVHLEGDATFSDSAQGSTYTWDMGNGESLTGQIINYVYNEPGIYITYLVVSDPRNCRNTNMVRTVIQVSGDPDVTSTIPDVMCYNEEYTFDVEGAFEGGEVYEEYTIDCTPPVTGTTFLPDGDNNIYSTTLTLNCYDEDAVITDGSQLLNVCINMEHSFSSDLTIRLISPNGTEVRLHDRGGGGTYIGQANDDGGLDPGIGETYCFNMDAAQTLINAPTEQGGDPVNTMFSPGDYLPIDGFDDFIGSPINGTWTLEIHDQAAIDNGYIFWWSMDLDPALLSDQFSFQPELTEIDWSNEEMVVSSTNNGRTVTVRPDIFGEVCFTGVFMNDNGCSFEKSFCTTVTPPIVTGEPRTVSNCADDQGNYTHDLTVVENDLANNPFYVYTYHSTQADAENGVGEITNPESYPLNVTDGVQTIYVRIVDTRYDCDKVVSFDVVTKTCELGLEQLPDLILCDDGDTGTFDLTPQTSIVYNNNLGYEVTYHNTEADAIANTGAIPDADLSAYIGTDGEEIWVRVTSINSPQVYETTSFFLFVRPNPTINPNQTAMYGCEVSGTGGAGEFDLSMNVGNITMNEPYLEVEYYNTLAEAELGDSSLALPTVYVGPSGTIYARVINTQTGCYSTTEQELIVRPTPTANTIAPMVQCDSDNDGFAVFNLASVTHQIAGNPVPTDIEVTFHQSMADAQNNDNAIVNVTNYVNAQSGGQTLYVRVGYEYSSCAAIVPLELIVSATPAIQPPSALELCDIDNNGMEVFDLTSKETEILNGLNPADYTITYHTTQASANSGTPMIGTPSAFSNSVSIVYVRVEDNTSGCYSVVSLLLRLTSTPEVDQPLPAYELCDDEVNDGFTYFDLTSQIPMITGGEAGLSVSFHYSEAHAEADSNPLPGSYQNAVANIQTIHVRVERTDTGCYTLTTMNLVVNAGPVVNVPTEPYVFCSNNQSGTGVDIDLTLYGSMLTNGTDYIVSYYETEADAISQDSPILAPATYDGLTANQVTVWLRITDEATGCWSIAPITIVLEIKPFIPNDVPDLTLCDTTGDRFDGSTIFDLTSQTTFLTDAQTQTGSFDVTYYTSEANAQAGTPAIGNPEQYPNTQNGQIIWYRIERTDSEGGCFAVGSFALHVDMPMALNVAPNLTMCDAALPNNSTAVFDLTVNEGIILGGEVFGVVVKYHTSQAQAQVAGNSIANPSSYNTNGVSSQVIWVSVTNENGCISVTSFNIRVLPLPEPNMNPTPLTNCEEVEFGGEATFILSDKDTEIANNDPDVLIQYYYSEADALAGIAGTEIPKNDPFLSTTTVIYVRVSTQPHIESESCSVVLPLDVIVNAKPNMPTISPFLICEENATGFHQFNLQDKFGEILGNRNPADFTIKYYTNEVDAEADENPIAYNYTNTTQWQQEIWVRLEDNATGCHNVRNMFLRIEERVFAYEPESVEFCDIDGVNDGLTTVDLTIMDNEIKLVQAIANTQLGVFYYASQADYLNGNPIPDATNYTTVSNPQTIIAEVYQIFTDINGNPVPGLCRATVEFEISVIDAPEMNDIADGFICIDYRSGNRTPYLMDTGLSESDHSFVWTRNNQVIAGATQSFYEATQGGTYTVTVTNNATGCSASQTIVLVEAPAITIDIVNTTDGFSDTNAIEVIVSPNDGTYAYEYALDEGAYQTSNIFLDVAPGEHTVWVRVVGSESGAACPASERIVILNYPKFFTPNGDGYNDTWNIWTLKSQPESKIYIFDRHGKLLKQLSPNGEGWDGTFNGRDLPSTDYWFSVEYIEPNTGLNKEFRGHFTLKR